MAARPPFTDSDTADEAVRATCDDATTCKRFASSKGYWRDPYIQYFVRTKPPLSKPLIETHSTDSLLLGDDTTTTTTHVATVVFDQNKDGFTVYLLLFPPCVTTIIRTVADGHSLDSDRYCIIGADLRDVVTLDEKLKRFQLNPEIPTLLLSECVLVYMGPGQASSLLHWAAETFHTAMFINYEQKERFLQSGWEHAEALDMMSVYGLLPRDDLARIESLEFLDEKELLQQLLQHYCICWANKDKLTLGLSQLSF
ncbi:hypothetical protein NHX12_025104 [Muraenolepis orangiensis]|uniref:Leucine carboxyl methyltransferase 1 n=1 Tax=Muraenolepis orangiensis TaxID=630683 RepID=A0A9Q0EJJ1_9TELE|nr:hypothetical protein NHX12_025104 [Muraenolepis orangiensis]